MKKNTIPYIISQDDWDDPDYDHYDKVFVEYDSVNDSLTELSGIIYDKEERAAIGEGNIHSLVKNSEGIIQVRNDRLEIDYELTR